MTDWKDLGHAYGAAEDIPGLLAQAAAGGPDDRAWDDLWSRICHQGTVYTASYAALPELAAIAQGWPVGQRGMPLILAAQIIASRDSPHEGPGLPASASAAVADLAELTEQEIRAHERGSDEAAYVCLLQASLALAGVEPWGSELEGVNDGEYEVRCFSCGADNFIAFGEWGCFSTLDDMYMKNSGTERHPLLPAEAVDLEEPASSLRARALDAGYPGLAAKLAYIFGRARCAGCDAFFRVDEAIAARRIS